MTKTYTFCRLMFLALVCCALSLSASADTVYELLNNESVAAKPLADGDKIIIVADGGTSYLKAMGPQTGDNKYRDPVDVKKNSDGTITLNSTSTVRVVTLKAAGGNYFYLYIEGEGYLYSSAAKSLLTNNTETPASCQNVSITFGTSKTTIEFFKDKPASGSTQANLLQYNPSSPRFCAYTSAQKGISIYREKPIDPETVPAPSSNIPSDDMECVNAFQVELTPGVEGDKIYYAFDDEPEGGIEYTAPITVESDMILSYWAVREDKTSDVKEVMFTFSVAERSLTPATGRVSA